MTSRKFGQFWIQTPPIVTKALGAIQKIRDTLRGATVSPKCHVSFFHPFLNLISAEKPSKSYGFCKMTHGEGGGLK